VLGQRHDLRLLLVVVQREGVALPGLRQEDASQVRVALVVDADQVVGLPLVPAGGAEHRRRRLVPGILLPGGDDDRHLARPVFVTREVVDALEAVLVLLWREKREVVEAGLFLQRPQDVGDVVRADDERRRVLVVVRPDHPVAEQGRDGVLVDVPLRCLRLDLLVSAHGSVSAVSRASGRR